MKQKYRRFFVCSLLLFALAVCLFGPVVAFAGQDAGACYSIQDADARSYCIARARGESSQCYTIQRPDLRSQCLAEVQR